MKEIKFRAWIPRLKKFIYWGIGDINGDGSYQTASPSEVKAVHQQYTTMKDKKGKEIYEGDIIISDTKIPCVVKWNGNGYSAGTFQLYPEDYKVIGNIYENPELLER